MCVLKKDFRDGGLVLFDLLEFEVSKKANEILHYGSTVYQTMIMSNPRGWVNTKASNQEPTHIFHDV